MMQRLTAIADWLREIAEISLLPFAAMQAALRRVALSMLDRGKAVRTVTVVG